MPKEKESKKLAGAEALDVFDKNGQFVRTYSEEQNDSPEVENPRNFVEKAEEFAKKIGGTVKKHS